MISLCKRTQGGFSLMEAVISLAVISLVLSGIWTAATSVHENKNTNKALADLMITVTNIRELYKGTKAIANTSNFTNATMIRAGVFPQNMLNGTQPITPWGSNITLSAPSTTSFSVNYPNLPSTYCQRLARKMGGNNRASGLININVNGSVFSSAAQLDAIAVPTTALNNCSTLTFTFSLK